MPATRSSDPKPPKTHILDFFYDEDDGCAFTARIDDNRFHIIVDPSKLKPKSGKESIVLTEYLEMLRLVRRKDQVEGSAEQQHNSGAKKFTPSEDRDSGIDISADEETNAPTNKTAAGLSQPEPDPMIQIQNWSLRCFGDEVPRHRDGEINSKQERTIQEWYEVAVKYYEVRLTTDQEHIQSVQIHETPDLQHRVDDLLPRLPLPKKLRSLPIPWIPASEVTVLAETDEPPPIHPSLVRTTLPDSDQKTYFFKPVDPTQPQPPKREIELLHRIHSEGLAKEFLVPKIEALVGWKDSKIEAMGYLLSVIDDPIPLTKLLDSEVDESKRKRWARKTKKIVEKLHEHGIVWGDAKADNFLVDSEDRLWVIDFGGSYTEGWVDANLNETVEGDDVALDKIANGLKDPDGMTVDWNEGGSESGSRKRKRQDEDEEDEEGRGGSNEASHAGKKSKV